MKLSTEGTGQVLPPTQALPPLLTARRLVGCRFPNRAFGRAFFPFDAHALIPSPLILSSYHLLEGSMESL